MWNFPLFTEACQLRSPTHSMHAAHQIIHKSQSCVSNTSLNTAGFIRTTSTAVCDLNRVSWGKFLWCLLPLACDLADSRFYQLPSTVTFLFLTLLAPLIAFRFHCFIVCLTRVLRYWTFLYTGALQGPFYYYFLSLNRPTCNSNSIVPLKIMDDMSDISEVRADC